MDCSHVPQQNISTYSGNKKAMYAVTESGDYTVIASSGWKVEEEVTKQALEELERLAKKAYKLVLDGHYSPLYFHMYNKRMDITTLAQSCGLFKWRVKRHLRPHIFKKLSPKILARYEEALGVSKSELLCLPKQGDI